MKLPSHFWEPAALCLCLVYKKQGHKCIIKLVLESDFKKLEHLSIKKKIKLIFSDFIPHIICLQAIYLLNDVFYSALKHTVTVIVPAKAAGCNSVVLNPRWWRNLISLTYCCWWERETEEKEETVREKRSVSAAPQETSFIPDWIVLSCLCLLFLAALPARQRPIVGRDL